MADFIRKSRGSSSPGNDNGKTAKSFATSFGFTQGRRTITRRMFTAGALALASIAEAHAREQACSYAGRLRNARPLVKRSVNLPDRTYSTYPNVNGFLSDGRLVVAAAADGGRSVKYLAVEIADGARPEQIAEIRGARMYFSVSKNGVLACSTVHGVKAVDLARGGRTILDWTDPATLKARDTAASLRYNADVDVSADGAQVVATRVTYGANRRVIDSRVVVLDVATGEARTIFETPGDQQEAFPLDHAHFSPHDPGWLCFCDASPRSLQRMWVWHPRLAYPARPLVDQRTAPKQLLFTHERALFDRPALLTVAHGGSSGTPRGLYEVPFSGAPARLVSESNRDLHCNASRDGRWYVVSLQGAAIGGQEGAVLDLCPRPGGAHDPDWLRSQKGFSYSDIVLVDPVSGRRAFLGQGTNANAAQPYEVQPAISPDGGWVVIKDARRPNVLALEIDQTALRDFLAG